MNALLVFLGSGLGGVARWWLAGWVGERTGHAFPWGTLVVNMTGSFLIGLFATLTGPDGRFPGTVHLRQFVMLGVFGGYTTFSSFSYQTLQLAGEGQWVRAGLNVMASVAGCLVAVALGHGMGLMLAGSRGSG